MSNISTPVIIIAILVILGIVFFIHLKTKGTIKKATVPLLLLILTTALGVLADEAIRRTNIVPETSGVPSTLDTDKEYETDNLNNEVLNNKPRNDLHTNDTDTRSITDLLCFLLPTSREFVKNRDKTYYPDWILILLSLLGGLLLTFGVAFDNLKHKTFKKVLFEIKIGLILSYINCYVIYFLASWDSISGKSVLDIILVALTYFLMLIIFIAILAWEDSTLNG